MCSIEVHIFIRSCSLLSYRTLITVRYRAEESGLIALNACVHVSLTKGELLAAVCIGLNAGKLLTRFIFFFSFDAPNHNAEHHTVIKHLLIIRFSPRSTAECETIKHEPSDSELLPSKQKIRPNIPFSSFTVCAGSLAGECRWPRDMRVRENDFLSIMSEDFTLWVICVDRASVLQGGKGWKGGEVGEERVRVILNMQVVTQMYTRSKQRERKTCGRMNNHIERK